MILYNDIEPSALEWLDNLQHDGQLPWGKLDGRSIKAIVGSDLIGVKQFHTFAGIGGWPLALKLADWPDDREVWTGSCPCQPYSAAGKQQGDADPRNLWPDFFRLIQERRPLFVFGEQVASAIRHGWLDRVFADLEGIGYACGAAVLGAHSCGAPHIRQRLYWGATLSVEHAASDGREQRRSEPGERGPVLRREPGGLPGGGLAEDAGGLRWGGRDVRRDEGHQGEPQPQGETSGLGAGGGVGNGRGDDLGRITGGAPGAEAEGHRGGGEDGSGGIVPRSAGDDGGVADDERRKCEGGLREPGTAQGAEGLDSPEQSTGRGSVCGPWSDFRLVPCTDGKTRRTGARVFPLAYGIPRGLGGGGAWRKGLARSASRARVGMLKGAGNAIVPALAAEFILAFMDSL